jgi:hypothetical protein
MSGMEKLDEAIQNAKAALEYNFESKASAVVDFRKAVDNGMDTRFLESYGKTFASMDARIAEARNFKAGLEMAKKLLSEEGS